MAKKQDKNMDGLLQEFEELKVSSKPKFVVNSIIYADGEESEESSDEEYDSDDKDLFYVLDISNRSTIPYRPYTIKVSKAKKTSGKEVLSKPVGFVDDTDVKIYEGVPNKRESTIIEPFLEELYKSGFESGSNGSIEHTVSASLLLNRPLSLSTRKNNLLTKELQTKTESPITHSKFGIFWKFDWYGANNKKVKYETVRKFYKKLKRYDTDNDTSKAEEFISHCERGIAVPYQGLRELAKNHEKTKELVRNIRLGSPGSDVYLSVIDGDTVSFNGIYSAYLRIYGEADIKPTIMSTCYEFTKERETDQPFVEGSKLCRKIRVATAKFVKLGGYITEPNVCILIPKNEDTLSESFIDTTIKLGNAESAALMRNLIKSRGIGNLEVVISDDNPLLTTIPPRVRKTKSGKTPIKFSKEFESGLGPTEKDLVSFKQMSQSHVHEGVWFDNLYINRAFDISGNHFRFKGLLTRYLDESKLLTASEERELFEMVTKEVLACIKRAYIEKEKAIQDYKDENLRDADQQELIDFINEHDDFEIEDFDSEFLQIIANADIVSLLEDAILDLEELSDTPTNILRELLNNDSVVEELKEESITFQDLLKIYAAISQQGEVFSDIFEEFINAINNGEFSVSEIVHLYIENSMHLMFIGGDPTDIVYQNSDDESIVKFGIENYDVDICWIREELGGERDYPSVALMDFDIIIGTYEDYEDENCLGSYEEYDEYY